MVRDIDDIDNRRRDNAFKYNFNKKYFETFDNDNALENYKKKITNNNIYDNNNYYDNNHLSRSYSMNNKNNAIYNMMFGGNRTPNPYNNYYRYENLY